MEKTDRRVQFRPARRDDAVDAAPLLFASGKQEFGYLFGVPPDDCIAFLREAFVSSHGRFSWQRHWVATTDSGVAAAILAAHGSQSTLWDNLCFAWMSLSFFGLRRTFGVLKRGIVLESELPPPRPGQTLLAHCATREDMRSHGFFSALLNAAQTSDAIPSIPRSERLILDVLVSNKRAAQLYRRLGFVALPRTCPRARSLPPELESVRMRFEAEKGDRSRCDVPPGVS